MSRWKDWRSSDPPVPGDASCSYNSFTGCNASFPVIFNPFRISRCSRSSRASDFIWIPRLMFSTQVGSKAVSQALKAFSHIDGLILNHGTLSPVKRIADADPQEWRAAYDVNFFSNIAFVSPFFPASHKQYAQAEARSNTPSRPSANQMAALSSPLLVQQPVSTRPVSQFPLGRSSPIKSRESRDLTWEHFSMTNLGRVISRASPRLPFCFQVH